MKRIKAKRLLWVLFGMAMTFAVGLYAQSEPAPADPSADIAITQYAIDNFFLFICAVLVIFMQAGFALVESGLNSAKNAVNILFKNLMDFVVGGLIYYLFAYKLMYPGVPGGFFEWGGFFLNETGPDFTPGPGVLHPQVDFLFQVAFAATAATIVSGAVAGRLKFGVYMIYSALIVGLVYPISGYWKWGGGWLNVMGFHDFAGSLVVHAVGGFAGLAAAIVLGPRIGRFSPEGKPQVIPGHNLGFATLGVFILLIGWYGFNPGSQLKIVGAENTALVMLIAVNTTLAAIAGAVSAMAITWFLYKKPELSMALNGLLAGLVGITANCDTVSNGEAVIIGLVAGVLVWAGVKLLDMLKIDDPVGAWPVHGLNGLWGGIATGIFGTDKDLVVQLIGSFSIIAWAFVTMLVIFLALKYTIGIRVSREEELKGLDIGEHGEEAYHGFSFYTVE